VTVFIEHDDREIELDCIERNGEVIILSMMIAGVEATKADIDKFERNPYLMRRLNERVADYKFHGEVNDPS
jgi:hypothetical protein